MKTALSASVIIYILFYIFEGPIRYGFHLIGADALIFIRDAVLILPIAIIFFQQFARGKIHPAYFVFMAVVLLHGTVMMLNIGSFPAVLNGAKVLLTPMVGAIAAATLFRPSRRIVMIIALFWSISWAGIMLDKYYVDFPWTGMQVTIGDLRVEISHDWQMTGESKRAGGFMRSSINAANVEPLLALLLLFNLRSKLLRVAVALLTVPALFWTTQKGAMLAYLLVIGTISCMPRHPFTLLRIGIILMVILAVLLPVALPGYNMPHSEGVFSFSSFNQRIEEMWPQAWQWIHDHEIFPFGVGLGGIGSAQRLYTGLNEMNPGDNMFVFMYGYFGVMALAYLSYIIYAATGAKSESPHTAQALATLMFLMGYAIVISILEDQMASLFLGAALGWLYYEKHPGREAELLP